MELSWKTKGIVLTAPLTGEVDDVVKFIDEFLAKRGYNMLVLQTRYRYQFKSHPEVRGYDALSYEDVKKLLRVCQKNNIKLVPKMNLLGHQSGNHNTPSDGILHGHNVEDIDTPDALLSAYPEFDEQKGQEKIYYARSICPSNDRARAVICDLMDELMDVFESDTIHIGCDEAFNMAICPECAKKSKAEIFATWINSLNDHVRAHGGKVLMWGDRLISTKGLPYHGWEADDSDSYGAIDTVSRDIIICDWHYDKYDEYKSIDIFADAGFKIMVSPWRNKSALDSFIEYAKLHDKGHIVGFLMTTWCGSGDLAKRILYGEDGKWQHTNEIATTLLEI